MTDGKPQPSLNMAGNTNARLLLPATPQCAVCEATKGLSHCASCKVESYCCREHQKSEWASHKSSCNAIKKTRAALEREEQTLRSYKGDVFTPPKPFETNAGRFWRFPAAQPYLKARLALVKALLKNESREAIETALSHSRGMLDLARLDRINVRCLMPTMYLRLGRDQECYDFIKWWYFAMQDCRNGFEPTTPYLTMKGEDVFEPIVFHLVEREVMVPDLNHMVSLMLVKIRALLDLRELRTLLEDDLIGHVVSDHGSLPDVFSYFRTQLSVSSIIAHHEALDQLATDPEVLEASIWNLEAQVSELYAMVVKVREHLWCKFISPIDGRNQDFLTLNPAEMACKGCGEAAEVLQNTYLSWAETPGALAMITDLALKDRASCTAKALKACSG